VTVPDVSITLVLKEIRELSEELVALRADVKLALTHGGDIAKLQDDVLRIESHLDKIDEFMAGPPALTERLAALERKQEKDRKTAARQTTDAGTLQEGVNVGFRDKFAQLFGITGDLQQASLRLFGILALCGSIIIYVLARALGA
jgi:hypothetical protein